MTQQATPDPQPDTTRQQPTSDVPPMPSEVTGARQRAPRPAGGRWRRAMMPLGKMARRTTRHP